MKKIFLALICIRMLIGCVIDHLQITPIFDAKDFEVDDHRFEVCPIQKQSFLPKKDENLTKKCSK